MLRSCVTLAIALLFAGHAGAQQETPIPPAAASKATVSAPAKSGGKATRPTPQTGASGTVSGSSAPPPPGKDRALDNDLGHALSSGALKF